MQVSHKPILPAEAFNFHGCRTHIQRINEVSKGKKINSYFKSDSKLHTFMKKSTEI